MPKAPPRNAELVRLIEPLTPREGTLSTALPEVSLIRASAGQERMPLLYEPGLIIVAQGRKVVYLGDRQIHYDPGQYLVQTLALPLECEIHARAGQPLLGLFVHFDPAVLGEMATAMGGQAVPEAGPGPLPMASVAMTPGMQAAVTRLLHALHDRAEVEAMGEARVRDVLFEALKGEQGPALRALVLSHGNYSRIVQVLSDLRAHWREPFSVGELARRANMSVSTFHQHFKEITRTSPVQYMKRLRLIKAQQLLGQDRLNVNQTAVAVGYRSVTQFSRDYKRYFGIAPLRYRKQRQRPTEAAGRPPAREPDAARPRGVSASDGPVSG